MGAFGSCQAAAAHERYGSALGAGADEGSCDKRYMDDGQLVARPNLSDHLLRAFDAAVGVGQYSARRGPVAAGNAKRSCRMAVAEAIKGWGTDGASHHMHALGGGGR